MTLLQNFIRVADSFLCSRRCLMLHNRNNWNVEVYFGSKSRVPSPPKRPLTAYMIFCKENRKDILKDNPSLSSTEQIKILAEKWTHLTEDMKKPYQLSARQNTQVYGEEHKKFYESLTEEQKEELAKLKADRMESRRMLRYKRALRDSGMPKAPKSAYTLFIQEEAKKKPSVKSASEFIKKAADSWKRLSPENKRVFEVQSEREKVHCTELMKQWRTRMLLDGNKKVLKAYEELKGKVLEMEGEVVASPTGSRRKEKAEATTLGLGSPSKN